MCYVFMYIYTLHNQNLMFTTMSRIFITFLVFFLLPGAIATAQKGKNKTKERTASLHWTEVRDKDILWSKMVMREIDLRYSVNQPLLEIMDSAGKAFTFNQLFYNMVKANALISNLVGDTVIVQDSTLALLTREMKRNDSSCVQQYIVVEEWEFSRERGKMEVHILWIGPYMRGYGKSIKDVTRTRIPCLSAPYQPWFAVKYNDLQKAFEQYKTVAEIGKKKDTITLLEYFEGRHFASKIICVEGAKGNELFNKDKDGWVY